MKAFLTGSRKYGTPKPESDVDLVVFLTPDDLESLAELADAEGSQMVSCYGAENLSIRFGRLNLICVTSEPDYEVWREGTETLHAAKPVSREIAKAMFLGLEARARINRAKKDAAAAMALAADMAIPQPWGEPTELEF